MVLICPIYASMVLSIPAASDRKTTLTLVLPESPLPWPDYTTRGRRREETRSAIQYNPIKMDFATRLQRASSAIEGWRFPGLRMAYMALAVHAAKESLQVREGWHIQRIQDGKPRALSLALVDMIYGFPFILLWLALGMSFMRNSGFRSWMLGGAFVGLLLSVVLLTTIISRPVGLMVDFTALLVHLGVLGGMDSLRDFFREMSGF